MATKDDRYSWFGSISGCQADMPGAWGWIEAGRVTARAVIASVLGLIVVAHCGGLVERAAADTTYEFVKVRGDGTAYAVSPSGLVAFRAEVSSIPSVANLDGKRRQAGDRDFTPTAINDAGAVVGVRFDVSGPEQKQDFAFLAPATGPSVLLRTGDALVGAAINNSGAMAVIESGRVTFFDPFAPAAAQAVVRAEVLAATNQEFTSGHSVLLKDGSLLTPITDTGTARFAVVSQSGTYRILSTDVIPPEALLLGQRAEGDVSLLVGAVLFGSDLVNAPTPIAGGVRGAINRGLDGLTVYTTEDVSYGGVDGFPSVYSPTVYASSKRNAVPLECLFPDQRSGLDINLVYANEGGVLVVRYYGGTPYRDGLALLVPTGKGIRSYCPSVAVRIIGKCASAFKHGETNGGAVPAGTRCEAEVTVRQGTGAPLSKALVATTSSGTPTVIRGRTDKRGVITFSFKVDGYTSFEVVAPYRDRKLHPQAVGVSVQN